MFSLLHCKWLLCYLSSFKRQARLYTALCSSPRWVPCCLCDFFFYVRSRALNEHASVPRGFALRVSFALFVHSPSRDPHGVPSTGTALLIKGGTHGYPQPLLTSSLGLEPSRQSLLGSFQRAKLYESKNFCLLFFC